MREKHICPTCQRPFKSVFDYPRVRVLAVKELPIPEAVDRMSEAAAQKRRARRGSGPRSLEEELKALDEGINMTPAIAEACRTAAVRDYLKQLAGLCGHEVPPRRLRPRLKAHGIFRWAYPIPGTDLYLSLDEGKLTRAGNRTAEVRLHCDGPNLGSAGGPTLQELGAVARVRYVGLLAP